MAHHLFRLAEQLERHAQKTRAKRAMEQAQANPHLARDVGLPHRPLPKVRFDQW